MTMLGSWRELDIGEGHGGNVNGTKSTLRCGCVQPQNSYGLCFNF